MWYDYFNAGSLKGLILILRQKIIRGEVLMKLVICGNGMDLHVGFKTSYKEYRRFLDKAKFIQGKSAISLIEGSKFFVNRDADCWSDLEKSLTFDAEKYIEELLFAYDRNLEPYDEQKSRSQIEAASKFEKNNPESIAFDFTNSWFFEWIGREFYNNVEKIKANYDGILKVIFNDEESIFVNFNYTPTLESIFEIEKGRILYIHNRFPEKRNLPGTSDDLIYEAIESGKKKFQFGSTDNKFKDWLRILKSVSLKSSGKLINKKSIEEKIQSIFRSFSKNLNENYDILEKFLQGQKVEEVVVIGHSFLGVDEPYYRDVLVPKLKESKWTLYCHDSREAAQLFVEKYNISEYEMIDW